jgi:hypothetical protein
MCLARDTGGLLLEMKKKELLCRQFRGGMHTASLPPGITGMQAHPWGQSSTCWQG